MAVIRASNFGGMLPIFDPRLLPDANAVLADNTRLDGGSVGPFLAPALTNVDGSGSPGLWYGNIGGSVTVGKLYRYTDSDGVTKRWLAWPRFASQPIDCAPSPIPQDQYGRLYWTVGSDKAYVKEHPVIQDTANQQTTQNTRARVLGLPAPANKPQVAASTDTTQTIQSGILGITQAAPAVVTFSVKPIFSSGQIVSVIIPNATSTPIGMSELSGKQYLVGKVDLAQNTIELAGSDTSKFTVFNPTGIASVERVFLDSDNESRAYVTTFVSDWGEESKPSPPSDVINVLLNVGVVTLTMDAFTDTTTYPGLNGANGAKRRIYRTVSGQSGTQFFFTDEIPITQNSYVDSVKPAKIGELIPSTDWAAPVAGMFGLTSMPNGFLIGFKGNTVYACEAYLPHAWPDKYRKTLDYQVVGAATMGQSAVIATNGRPYLATGSDPFSLTCSVIELNAPCINKEGIASIGEGVCYPTYEGLALITPIKRQIITQNVMTKAQWLAYWLNGYIMSAIYHDGYYIALASGVGGSPSLAFRISDGPFAFITLSGITGQAPAKDTTDDSLYWSNTNLGSQLQKWEGSPNTYTTFFWTSKVFTLPDPASMAVCQVFASSFPVQLIIRATQPTAGDVNTLAVVGNYTVNDTRPFRLPSGFKAREWQVTTYGTAKVQSIVLATSMTELRAAP